MIPRSHCRDVWLTPGDIARGAVSVGSVGPRECPAEGASSGDFGGAPRLALVVHVVCGHTRGMTTLAVWMAADSFTRPC
jgi:hypothetical protein